MRLLRPRTAAGCAAGLLGSGAAYQVALAAGAPWGATAYGGRAETTDGVLSRRFRMISAGSAIALGAAAWTVAAHAGVAPHLGVSRRALSRGTIATACFLTLNAVTNTTAKHPVERWLFGSISMATSVLVWKTVLDDRRSTGFSAGRTGV